jgi:uncharacterized Zn ribbon protein
MNPKDANGKELNEGDCVETLVEIPISGTKLIIPKGTQLGRIRWWYEEERVEVNRVRVSGSEMDLLVKTEFLRKV